MKVIYNNTHCKQSPTPYKMAYFKPKRHLFKSLSLPKHSQKIRKSADTHQRNKYISAIHHQSSAILAHRTVKTNNQLKFKIFVLSLKQTYILPYPLILKKIPRAIPAKHWTATFTFMNQYCAVNKVCSKTQHNFLFCLNPPPPPPPPHFQLYLTDKACYKRARVGRKKGTGIVIKFFFV